MPSLESALMHFFYNFINLKSSLNCMACDDSQNTHVLEHVIKYDTGDSVPNLICAVCYSLCKVALMHFGEMYNYR